MLKFIVPLFAFAALPLCAQITYEAKDGPGKGKNIVLLGGDEEYRSEEALPMLGKLLSQKFGFKCSVVLSVGADGTIDPKKGDSAEGVEALDSADLCVMLLRFRHWPDDKMKHFDDYVKAGKPIIALRTSTHAFNNDKKSAYAKYAYNANAESSWEGGFGRQVLGETWVSHWGKHKKEATKGVLTDAAKADPIFTGITELFGDTDVYEAHPPADAKILALGQVLTGMAATDGAADYPKKTNKGVEQPVNNPMQPVVWSREVKNDAGTTNKILCTTMGSATDLANESTRRMVVNACFVLTGLAVPEKADVSTVGEFKPSFYGFDSHIKGVKPADLK